MWYAVLRLLVGAGKGLLNPVDGLSAAGPTYARRIALQSAWCQTQSLPPRRRSYCLESSNTGSPGSR